MVNETNSENIANNTENAAIEGEAAQEVLAATNLEAAAADVAVEAPEQGPTTEADSAAAPAAEVDLESAASDAAAEAVAAEEAPKALTWAEMTPEERFRATTKLIFIAPDVPPIQPRPRHSEFGRLDDILDQQFERHTPRDRDRGHGRDMDRDRDHGRERDHGRDRGQDRDRGHDRDRDEDHQERDSFSSRRRRQRVSDPSLEEETPRRAARQAPVITEPQKVKGSTRLEAKKQRRRDGRDIGRRRNVITESEFLARREAVDREMIVRTTADRVQIGVLEDRVLVEHYVARSSENSLIGNVYLGRVQNVLPSMEAAFVDIGRGRNAVLYSGEVDWSEFEGSNSARRIENALKPGDQVLVQVTKDPVGHKGARLTSQISLPGRFLVYVPGGAMNGISRKLPDTERARLKKILKEVLPSGAGVIVRTAAEGATEEQLTHDVERLARQWESIQQRTAKGGGPVLLHSEPDMLIKIIRDVFNEDFHRLVISGNDTYRVIEEYLTQVAPDLMQRVERYENERDIFSEYRVTEQISKALDRKVWLPSGGSLVIDRTEAMTVVDVNTGKFVGSGGNLEETVTKNNLESAEEIVRQLRLRDIGGIIVIDFIDMVLESNRDLVLRRLVECLSRDRTKHQVAEVTSLGLVQMTRKKLGLGLLESFSDPCDVCAGRGIIVHHEPISKHRGEAPTRGRRNKNSQQNNGHGQSSSQGSHAPKPDAQSGSHTAQGSAAQTTNSHGSTGHTSQAHAITDGAKNMLAQVAASTLAAGAHDVAPASPPEADAAPKSGVVKSGVVKSGIVRPGGVPAQESAVAGAGDLLSSLLDALPEPPAAGAGRTRGRRVSSSPVRTPNAEHSSEAKNSDSAEEAKRALAEALAETSRLAEESRD